MAFGDFTVNRSTTKTVLGKDGYLKEVAINEPAVEFNADGSYRGLLVEPAATNLCLRSENFSMDWSRSNATPVQSTETTPDGNSTNKYIKLVDDNSGGTGVVRIQQERNVSANKKYTASIFAKADGLSFLNLVALNFDGSTDGSQFFGLSGAGTLGSGPNLDDSSIEAYPNGWYRCSITWTQGVSDTNFTLRIFLASSISSSIVPLDGTSSIFIWGAQIEQSPIATSYIPTTASPKIRTADDIYLQDAVSLIGQEEGTVYLSADLKFVTGQTQYLISLNDGTEDNRILLAALGSSNQIELIVLKNGASVTTVIANSPLLSGLARFVLTYTNTKIKVYCEGELIIETSSIDISDMGTLSQVNLGERVSLENHANMHIETVALTREESSYITSLALTSQTYDTYNKMATELGYTLL